MSDALRSGYLLKSLDGLPLGNSIVATPERLMIKPCYGEQLCMFHLLPERPDVFILSFYNELDGQQAEALEALEGKEPSMLYCGTLILRSKESKQAGLSVLEKTNAPLFLDVNLRDPWWDKELAELLLQKATWLKCNEQEAEILFGIQSEEQGRQRIPEICKDLNLQLFILTLSERGAMVTDGQQVWQAAPPQNDKPFLDSVGAGDSCACGFIEGIHKGSNPETSLYNALKLASEVCRVRGGVFPLE